MSQVYRLSLKTAIALVAPVNISSMECREGWGILALIVLLAAGLAGCQSDAYEVTENVIYDRAIGLYGTFDFYEPKSDSVRADRPVIAALGMSAGGHLATMVALRDDPAGPAGRVNTAVNLDGEHDMTMPPELVMDNFADILTTVMGHPGPWSDSELRDISTVTFARPGVSVLTVHGAGDDDVYVTQAERLTAALRSAGAETEFIRIEGDQGNCHSDCWKVPRARTAIHSFLDRRLAHDGNLFLKRNTAQGRR